MTIALAVGLPLAAAAQPEAIPRTARFEAEREPSIAPAAERTRRSTDPDAALDAFARPSPAPSTLTEPLSDPLQAFPPAPPPPALMPLEYPIGLARLRPFTPPTPPAAAHTTVLDAQPTPAVAAQSDVRAPVATESAAAEPHDTAATPRVSGEYDEPAGPMHANLGAALAAGESLDKGAGGANPLGFGVGVRGEYRLRRDLGWVVGARALYFFGTTTTLPTGKLDVHSWLFAADAGHAFDLRPLWLEPLIALGLQARSTSGRPALTTWNGAGFVAGSRSDTQLGFYLAPGLRATVPLAALSDMLQSLYAGLEAQLGLVFADSVSSQVELLVHAGLRL